MIEKKTLEAAAKGYADMAAKEFLAEVPKPTLDELKMMLEETYIAAFEKAEAVKADPALALCSEMANCQIVFVKREGPDHAFACWGHAGKMLEQIVQYAVNSAARVSKLPLSSDDQCEWGVE